MVMKHLQARQTSIRRLGLGETVPMPDTLSPNISTCRRALPVRPLHLAAIAVYLVLAACGNSNSNRPQTPLATDFGQPRAKANQPVNMGKVRQHKLYIAPVIGAPAEVVAPLSSRFDNILQNQSIPLSVSGESGADYALKGYFSNMVENNQTVILYVWDVVDKQGNRVHRLQGQEKVSGKGGWSSIPPSVMNKIADDTMADYFRWASANS
jgi:hypothetical protein